MENIELSPEAKRQIAALEATNERLLVEGMELKARTKALEELTHRKEQIAANLQEILDKYHTGRQAIDMEKSFFTIRHQF